MRDIDSQPKKLFGYVSMEDRIPKKHPLRTIRRLTDDVLDALSSDFGELYSRVGRPGIAPEKLLRGGVSARFLAKLVGLPEVESLLSKEHFSVDGTCISAWASVKSFRPKEAAEESGGANADGAENGGADACGAENDDADSDGAENCNADTSGKEGGRNEARDFRGERWSNETRESATGKDVRLYRKGKSLEAKLSYLGHALIENRSGLVVDGLATRATGTAEHDAAELMLMRRADVDRNVTLAADKGYDVEEFVNTCKAWNVEPHVVRNTSGRR